jgi:hypothetical protein
MTVWIDDRVDRSITLVDRSISLWIENPMDGSLGTRGNLVVSLVLVFPPIDLLIFENILFVTPK